MPRPVLYAIVCGSPASRDVGTLVGLAQEAGWDVCVVASPDALKFLDIPRLAAHTGHPVRTHYKNPGEPDLLPAADAMIVAPATVNTVNKWAAGITDTLVLGLLVEAYGYGVPTVVVPYTNKVMAQHPSLHESLAKLRTWGVHVLNGELGLPGQNDHFRNQFPWRRALQAVSGPVASHVEPGAAFS